MQVTYYGHSCFSVKVNNKHILFDPFITYNPLAKHINVDEIQADYILVSHGHEDHVADLIPIAKRTGAKVVCAWEIHVWLNNQGITNTHPMNIGGAWKFEGLAKVKCVNAIHSSSLPDGTYGGSPMGFIIESNEGCFYYSGDTALTYDMKLIGEYRKVDFALLPIGDNFTMSADNAIIAADFINCNKIIGLHYDTFGYIVIDKEQVKKKFENANLNLVLMDIGQTLNI
jgi:L-ascorbate metabolism protein UlaG (beta-lactamase superfamily)